MKIIIRGDLCNGCEKCVNTCFEVFHLWGMYLRSSFEVPDDTPHRNKIGKAVLECPRNAIRVVEKKDREGAAPPGSSQTPVSPGGNKRHDGGTMADPHEEQLKTFIREKGISAEHLSFDRPCHTVAEAAAAASASPEDLVKNICMITEDGRIVVAVVKGEDRVSASRVAGALNVKSVRMATPEEILERTGFPCGGTPSFGFTASFLVDPRVLEKERVYTGGGSESALVRVESDELVRASGGRVVRVRR